MRQSRRPHARAWAEGRRPAGIQHGLQAAAVLRVVTGEKTVAELSRDLDIAPRCDPQLKRYAEAESGW